MTNTRYVAEIHDDCLMIYVYRHAGICGPAQNTGRPATLTEADEWLKAQGFVRAGDWTTGTTYKGLMLSAELIEL
jgi:hypothetical protein